MATPLKFKVGDKCRVIKGFEDKCGSFYQPDARYIIITEIVGNNPYYRYDVYNNDDKKITWCSFCFKDEHLELFTGVNKISFMTNLIEKIKMMTKGEPDKTFIKVGITDKEDNLTPDGQAAYLNWKFQQDKAAFNIEVAQPLLAEIEKETK